MISVQALLQQIPYALVKWILCHLCILKKALVFMGSTNAYVLVNQKFKKKNVLGVVTFITASKIQSYTLFSRIFSYIVFCKLFFFFNNFQHKHNLLFTEIQFVSSGTASSFTTPSLTQKGFPQKTILVLQLLKIYMVANILIRAQMFWLQIPLYLYSGFY